jgi:uncharacterized protein (DUF305 family)
MNTKTQIILIATIALLLGVILGYLFSKSERYEHMMGNWKNDDNREQRQEISSLSNEDSISGMGGMHDMNGMGSVTSERDFIEGMIPHHEEAVATAKQVLARGGTTADMKKLAQDIITAQEKEIADMKSWYRTWYGEPFKDDGSYKPMMRDLSALSGTELDRAFLQDMIMHHMGALMMAQAVSAHTEHDEVKALVEAIAKTQSAEIITMRVLLRQI